MSAQPDEPRELTPEEVAAQAVTELPNREVMTLIDTGGSLVSAYPGTTDGMGGLDGTTWGDPGTASPAPGPTDTASGTANTAAGTANTASGLVDQYAAAGEPQSGTPHVTASAVS